MKTKRILVCGGRDFEDKNKLNQVLSKHLSDSVEFDLLFSVPLFIKAVIIQGGAKGADRLAKEFADYYDIPNIEFKADWSKYGKAAGGIRNKQMLNEGKPDLVIAFPTENSKGTWDMVRRAKRAGIDTVVVE